MYTRLLTLIVLLATFSAGMMALPTLPIPFLLLPVCCVVLVRRRKRF